jgi:heterodisulfide reductase subunit A-like polyferredoxin
LIYFASRFGSRYPPAKFDARRQQLSNIRARTTSINMNDQFSSPEKYDIVVLGSGEAGKYLAWTLAKEGKSAVVIERNTSEALARTSPVSQARISFTAPRWPRISGEGLGGG